MAKGMAGYNTKTLEALSRACLNCIPEILPIQGIIGNDFQWQNIMTHIASMNNVINR